MPSKKKKVTKKPVEPSKPKIEFAEGGEIRTNYGPIKAPAGDMLVYDPPEGKLQLGREYKLKDGWFAVILNRATGADPAGTPMVGWKKGFLNDKRILEWSPSVQAVEKQVEDFIFNNLEEN